MGVWKTRMLREMRTVEAWLTQKVQNGARILLGAVLVLQSGKYLASSFSYSEDKIETELKSEGWICLAEEISRQHSIWATPWLCLSAPIRLKVRGSNQWNRNTWMRKCMYDFKVVVGKAVENEAIVVRTISTVKEKPPALNWDKTPHIKGSGS